MRRSGAAGKVSGQAGISFKVTQTGSFRSASDLPHLSSDGRTTTAQAPFSWNKVRCSDARLDDDTGI
jgi:hypothetical protein